MLFRRGITKDRNAPVRFVDNLYAKARATRMRAELEVQAARLIDGAMARSGLAKPLVFVSGFWRSGTTWLQECLADALDAKTVFEPLSPLDPRRGLNVRALLGNDEDVVQAYIPRSAPGGDDLLSALDLAMTGRAESMFTLSCRRSVGDSFRRGVVVKDVRAQCQLDRIHTRYGVPVVHLRRHPCAVVSSLIRADWHWSFRRVPLATLFTQIGEAGEGAVDTRPYDADDVSRIAFCWAWSEHQAASSLVGQPWARIISYEQLAKAPQQIFEDLCLALQLHPKRAVAFDVPSASIHPAEFARRDASAERWRGDLTAFDVARIERIASEVFPAWRADI